jgi:hypothetical protein
LAADRLEAAVPAISATNGKSPANSRAFLLRHAPSHLARCCLGQIRFSNSLRKRFPFSSSPGKSAKRVFALDDPVIHPTPQKHVTKIDVRIIPDQVGHANVAKPSAPAIFTKTCFGRCLSADTGGI